MGLKALFKRHTKRKPSPADLILAVQQQIDDTKKNEEYMRHKIEEETKRARANAASDKITALAALKRKKVAERDLKRLRTTRAKLQIQLRHLKAIAVQTEMAQVEPMRPLTIAGARPSADDTKLGEKKVWRWRLAKSTRGG